MVVVVDFGFDVHFFLLFSSTLFDITQIKREPCQVSEVTTSNNFQSTRPVQLQTQPATSLHQEQSNQIKAGDQAIVKSEIKSPTEIATTASTVSISVATSNMDHNSTNSVQSG